MPKKNICFLLIDGLNSDYIGPQPYRKSPTPNIDALMKESVYYTHVYSSAPYTEGAMIELMAGYRTLSRDSFLENLDKAPKTVFEAFHNAGYDTGSIIWDFADTVSFTRGVKHLHLNRCQSINSIWYGRFRFYSELRKKQQLPEEKYKIMEDLLGRYFAYYQSVLTRLLNKENDTKELENVGFTDEQLETKIIQNDYENKMFLDNPREYCNQILDQGMNHRLFSIQFGKSYIQTEEMNKAFGALTQKYQPTIRKMKKLQKHGNRKSIGHVGMSIVSALTSALKKGCQLIVDRTLNWKRFVDNVGMQIWELSVYTDYSVSNIFDHKKKLLEVKNSPCAKEQFDRFLHWLDDGYKNEDPFMYYLHIDDIHVNPIPYSYSIKNYDLWEHEFQYMKDYVDNLDERYHGNLMYDVALHHVDEQVGKLIQSLKDRNIWDNTIFIVTSDHGFYYSYNDYRLDSVGNLYQENFHIPFIWHESGRTSDKKDGYYSQRDIPYTLLKTQGINPPESFEGIDMFSSSGRPNLVIEYPGRGSPDMDVKVLFFAAFDSDYKVCVHIKINEQLNEEHITEIYDEKVDPKETKNLRNSVLLNDPHIQSLLGLVSTRLEELKKEYARYC